MSSVDYQVHKGSSFWWYRNLEGINASGLKVIARNPAEFQEYRDQSERKPALDMGTAFHTLVLNPQDFDAEVVVLDHRSRNKTFMEEIEDINRDIAVITRAEYEQCLEWKARLEADEQAMALLTVPQEQREMVMEWKERWYGHPAKARLDVLHLEAPDLDIDWGADSQPLGPCVVDLKSAKAAEPYRIGGASWDFGYHTSMAWYRHAVHECGYPQIREAVLVVCGKKEGVEIYRMTDSLLDLGLGICREALSVYDTCLRTGNWPEPMKRGHWLDKPGWVK